MFSLINDTTSITIKQLLLTPETATGVKKKILTNEYQTFYKLCNNN